MINESLLHEFKEVLEKEKGSIEKELERFATKDEKTPGDWDTRFPEFGVNEGNELEKAADEVEEYSTLLPIEHSLETRLRDINAALEKIHKDNYGKCEKCGKEIAEERLKAYPAAKFCLHCGE